jgi:hypothetical protein
MTAIIILQKEVNLPAVADASGPTKETVFLIKVAPWAAVLSAWKEVEEEVVKRYGKGKIVAPIALAKELPMSLRSLFDQLRALRNTAAHSVAPPITAIQAEDYVMLAKRFLAELRGREGPTAP